MSNTSCERCNGTGKVFNKYHNKDIDCPSCQGLGYFEAYSDGLEQAICGQIIATRGKNKGKLKASYASPVWADFCQGKLPSIEDKVEMQRRCRAYYVWRMARFHGGVDMTMPMLAGLVVRGDPLLAKTLAESPLDLLADRFAKESFGSNMRAAKAWLNVL